ncbi:hypothetical protein C7401_108126 [Paraburkholderia unamae]|uniref:hypothetical protein n=1 Tax=Paraburkholderia unamae TaxID=219649 RepID=UPI000DC5E452|nr:hypothetical protein [Paraburkholderia unamae]RAR61190.1 hypothetical protein C7401_108126 [Paraburkholderia unamae]
MNKDDYPVETITTMGESRTLVTIPAGETVTYKFLSVPAEKIPKGDYEFGALVYTSIYVSGVNGAGGTVNFVSDTRSTPFTFDTDFPSTPQEWKDYEERQRAKLSEHVTPSGHAVAEDGYYRLISDTGQRSRWVYEFKKGAPSYKKELIYDSKGEAFLGRPVWQWEADLARKTLCSPGEPCPREGRWVGIKFAHRSWTADEYYLYGNRRFQAGETMPPVLGDGDSEVPYAHWKWFGA